MSPLNQDKSQMRQVRSFNDLEQTTAHQQHAVDREFDYMDRVEQTGVDRREFLTLMGASLAMAGLVGCRRPVEKIVPYVHQPEEIIPGKDLNYATAMALGDDVLGLLVETQDGRPVKVEGNPLHPASLGATHAIAQAATLSLYDVHRSDTVLGPKQGAAGSTPSTWSDFVGQWTGKLRHEFMLGSGKGLAVLSGASVSPTMARLQAAFRAQYPNAKWYSYEPVSNENAIAGIAGATGSTLRPKVDLKGAKVILSLDADFMCAENGPVANTRAFADGRRMAPGADGKQAGEMNRLYMVEAGYSITGGMADHRRQIRSSRIPAFAKAVVMKLREKGKSLPDLGGSAMLDSGDDPFLSTLAGDLVAAGSSAVVLAGRRQPAAVHAIVAAINAELRSAHVAYYEVADATLPSTASLKQLTDALNAGNEINTLVILGTNPVFDAPGDFDFAAALAKAPNSIHLGLHVDETAKACAWHLPMTHFMEEWGDLITVDGLRSVVQPMIRPLFEERAHATRVTSAIELVNLLVTGAEASGFDLVQQTWKALGIGADFETTWRRVLHDGIYAAAAAQPVNVSITSTRLQGFLSANEPQPLSGMEVVFQQDASIYDGRFCFNHWLQEMPDSITKLTWDNAAVMSAATAAKLGVRVTSDELGCPPCDVVTITVGGKRAELPAWCIPGIAEDTIVLNVGYGRQPVGELQETNGTNIYPLRASGAMHVAAAQVAKSAAPPYKLASTQDHHEMRSNSVNVFTGHRAETHPAGTQIAGRTLDEAAPRDRAMVRETSLDQYKSSHAAYPAPVHYPTDPGSDQPLTLYKHPLAATYESGKGYQWGMAIDLTTCTGCSACLVACQSENNIPVVGRERIREGREMHWIRIDRYFTVDPAKGFDEQNVGLAVQPVPCMHCENAPCEAVCPMTATVHDNEGLNVMVYNRCVGTRYCSNNCAYKVRRFNYFNFTKDTPQIQQMANNPDVTVRFRGVIEKCSYCLQRINQAKSRAKLDNSVVTDPDLKVACQQACPAGAIAFGNLNDPTSEVSRWKASDLDYHLLVEYNTRPRTSYLSRLRNPHKDLPESRVLAMAGAHHGSAHGETHGDAGHAAPAHDTSHDAHDGHAVSGHEHGEH